MHRFRAVVVAIAVSGVVMLSGCGQVTGDDSPSAGASPASRTPSVPVNSSLGAPDVPVDSPSTAAEEPANGLTSKACAQIAAGYQELEGPDFKVTHVLSDGKEYDLPVHAEGAGVCNLTGDAGPVSSYPDTGSISYAIGDEAYYPDDFDTMVTTLGYGDFDQFREMISTPDGWDLGAYRLNSPDVDADVTSAFLFDAGSMLSCRHDANVNPFSDDEVAAGFPHFVAFCDAVRQAIGLQ